MTPSDGKSQQYDSKSSLASKKMRMTLACVRCRSKKVKCDTKHPSCTRCFQAKVSCSYEGSSSQIDIYNLIKLNDTVDTLQKRIQYLESTIGDIQHTTPNSIASPVEDAAGPSSMVSPNSQDITPITPQGSKSASPSLSRHSHQWSLSLTSTGLRIDTNIVTIPNLYNILLSGVSQLDLNQQNTASSPLHYSKTAHQRHPSQHYEQPSEVDIADKSVMVQPKTPLWRSKMTTFPLYSTWSSDSLPKQSQHPSFTDRRHLHHKWPHQETTPVASALDTMIDIYCECFLCLPDTGYGGTIDERYRQGTLDPLLTNAIFAWSARHGAIYHDLYKGQDPNQVGECYFNVAKDLLKDRFTIPSIDTLHGVLILYIYAIGRPSKQHQQSNSTTPASEAYLFLGLAIRMCLDLKLHKERKDDDDTTDESNQPIEMERDRRFFWVLYFLETLCTLHSDRPFSLPSKDQITVAYPDVLGNEIGERRWRTEFMMKRFRITRIYRDIIQRTSQSTPLPLSCISELDADLCDWYDQLPPYMQYQQGDWRQRKWKSTSFREQACIKLNLEYHFQRCQLYAVFLKRKQDDKEEGDGDPFYGPSNHPGGNDNSDQGNEDEGASTAMENKAKNVCVTSATMTVELMQCWNQLQQRWCHFSLESLMMAVNIFEMLLKDDDVEQTKAHLTTVLDILQASPIQHHRHVIIVTTRIQKLLHMKSGNNGSDSDWVPRSDIGTTGIGSDENRDLQQQQFGATSVFIQHSIDMYNSFLPTQLSNGMMGVHYGDLPFSDFLYNPVMQLPPSSFGSYTTTIQQQQQQPWDASQPPPITTQLPLAQTYSPTPSTTVVALSPTYSVPPSDDYSTRSSAVSAASLWTTTLHQPTYASNGSAIFESLSLQDRHPSNQQPDPANGHPPPQHTSPYSTEQQ